MSVGCVVDQTNGERYVSVSDLIKFLQQDERAESNSYINELIVSLATMSKINEKDH